MTSPIEFFKEISQIPRGSGNESAIADYIENVAKSNSLFCIRDGFNNVFVRRSAHPSCTSAKPILFAAHTDMVCEKLPASEHNFMTDPLQLIEKDGWLFANGTTLGGDDGAGVATMLSLMTDTELIAPVTEYLFTSSEETGMDGAFGFDYSAVTSDMVINLDNSVECSACVGSASGKIHRIDLPTDRIPKSGKAVKISVKGLASGHSGAEINSGNQNATKLLSSLLCRIYESYPFNIYTVSGGGKDNVIPADAEATVFLCGTDEEKIAKQIAADFEKAARQSMTKADKKHFSIGFYKLKEVERNQISDMMTLKSTSTVLTALTLAPQGVLSYFPGSNEVFSSVNMGIARTEPDKLSISFLQRSADVHHAYNTELILTRLAHSLGAQITTFGGYPAWEYKSSSALQTMYSKACSQTYGKIPPFNKVHAGLECGIFYERLMALGKRPDIISIGPNVQNIHTTLERMEIASLDRLYSLLKNLLGSNV